MRSFLLFSLALFSIASSLVHCFSHPANVLRSYQATSQSHRRKTRGTEVTLLSSLTAEGIVHPVADDDNDNVVAKRSNAAAAAATATQQQSQPSLSTWLNARVTLENQRFATGVALVAVFAAVVLCRDVNLWQGLSAQELLTTAALDAWNQYSHSLDVHPIATKACTSATVYTIGDVIAQRTEGREELSDLDVMRVVRSMIAGLVGHGPMSHCWYNICDGFFADVLHLTAWWSFIPKVVVDQTVWGPIWNNSYIVLLGLMKVESPGTIWKDVKTSTLPLLLSGLKIWPLAHVVTYGLIPVENRLLWVDLVEILWVSILATEAASLSTSSGSVVASGEATEGERAASKATEAMQNA